MNKTSAVILGFIVVVFICFSCSKAEIKPQKDKKDIVQDNKEETVQQEKDFYTTEEFIDSTKALYSKGGITLYESGYIFDIPKEFTFQPVNIFGIEEPYYPPNEPIKKVSIKIDETSIIQNMMHIQVPVELYEENPELYIEAEHDGKTFIYNNKAPLNFSKETNYFDEPMDYYAYVTFINRNLYSKSDDFTIQLKNCKDDSVIATQVLKQPAVRCNYVVYKTEYESPFEELENSSVSPNEIYHLIYKGKGYTDADGGDMIVFSYGYLCNESTSLVYFPFLAVKTKTDTDGVCDLDFSIREPGQYKIDFYNEKTKTITETSVVDFIQVPDNEFVKYVEKPNTEWKVNSAEGLRLRNAPWGEKIGLLENGTELIQTEEIHYPFYDCIDDMKGFWIPVKRKNAEPVEKQETSPDIYANNPETEGWVYSGFLVKTSL